MAKQGLMERFGAWRASRPPATSSAESSSAKGPYATIASGVKDGFTVFVGGFAPFAILAILTISAGFYFNALRPFTGDVQSVVAYGTAGIVELVNLALFFVSAKVFWSGKTAHFLLALVIGLALTIISVIAQVLYLSNNLDQASLGKGADILAGLPLVGSLASTGLIIVTRALALHVAEFACCYVVARSSVSHKKIMQAQIEEQSERMLMQIGEQFIAFMDARMHGQVLDAATPPALAEAKETLHLPAVHGESEVASNGHGTFPGT